MEVLIIEIVFNFILLFIIFNLEILPSEVGASSERRKVGSGSGRGW